LPQTFADNEEFLPGRLAQAKVSCLSGISADIIAKRLAYLPPQVAEANFSVRQRLSSEAGGE
jgi:hypothetical protein